MGFESALRMRSIMGSGNEGFQVPGSQGMNLDEITGALNRIYPIMAHEKQLDRDHEVNMMRMRMGSNPHGGAMGQIANGMMNPQQEQPKNYVFDLPSEKQKQELALKRDALNEKKTESGNKLDFSREKLQSDNSNKGADRDIRQQRADTYDWKTKHPAAKLFTPKGGSAYLIDPVTHEKFDLGIDSGTLTDSDRIELNADKKLEQIGATGDESRKTEGVKSTNRLGEITAQGNQRKELKASPDNKPMQPSQQRTDQFLKARELASDPQYKDYIKIGEGGNFEVISSGDDMMDEIIRKKIYGDKSKDINLPKDDKSNKPKSNDPLGIRR